jgi:molecular chaperone DnaK
VPQIDVTFDIDANGIIHVSAKDLGSGNQQAITIKGDRRLSEDEIKKMVNEATKFEAEDKARREEIEVRNLADSAVFNAEKMLRESGDKIDAADRDRVQEGIDKVKKALDADNPEELKKQMEALTEAVYAVTTKLYQKIQAERQAQEAGGQAGAAPGQGDVQDADYTMKDE